MKLLLFVISVLFFFPASLPAQEWIAKAKEEKKVAVYHTTNVRDTTKIVEGFRKRYPFMEFDSYRGTGERLIQKITTEVRAGQNLADVYIISGLQTWLLKSMGYIAPYASPERDKVFPTLKDRQGYWTGIYWNLEVLGYNTKLVAASDVPKKWEDLLLPRWKGKIGLEEEDVNWYSSILHLMGEERGKEFMRRLARQRPQIRRGHTLLSQLLAAGEFPIGPTIRVNSAETLKNQGAPVDWLAIEPLAPNPPVCLSLPKNPPRPNAARLFIDYMLSREGQTIIYQLKRNPTRTDVEQPIPRASKIKLMELDHDEVAKHYKRYADEFREIFGIAR